jgi:hypothetical protein
MLTTLVIMHLLCLTQALGFLLKMQVFRKVQRQHAVDGLPQQTTPRMATTMKISK